MRTQLVVIASLVGSLAVAQAAPKKPPPKLAEVKAYVIDAKGNMIPHSQDFAGKDVLLAVKIVGGEAYDSATLTFTGVEDHSAAYGEAGKKPPPKKKHKVTRKVTLDPDENGATWAQLVIELTCYQIIPVAPQLTLGTSKLPVDLPGMCPFG